jgi:glycosyltransferase involved in cell wall biosynthesis
MINSSEVENKRILMVTHVSPIPTGAGNEFRILKLLGYLRNSGYKVCFVLRPLEQVEVPSLVISELSSLVDELYIFDKRVVNILKEDVLQLTRLKLSENNLTEKLTGIQNMFCPVSFVEAIRLIGDKLKPNIVIAEYVFMSRVLTVFDSNVLKIIDTHDVFSQKQDVIEEYNGYGKDIALTSDEEKQLLLRADVVLAIQDNEKVKLESLFSKGPVITVGVDLVTHDLSRGKESKVVLIVASNNYLNVTGVQDFVDYTWPLIKQVNSEVRLRIVGRITENITTYDSSIDLCGFVEDLNVEYSNAQVIVNPVRVGTGLKIKTIEALSWGKAHVAWPVAVDGIEGSENPVIVCSNVVDMANSIAGLLESENRRAMLSQTGLKYIRSKFNKSTVYRSLASVLTDPHNFSQSNEGTYD